MPKMVPLLLRGELEEGGAVEEAVVEDVLEEVLEEAMAQSSRSKATTMVEDVECVEENNVFLWAPNYVLTMCFVSTKLYVVGY